MTPTRLIAPLFAALVLLIRPAPAQQSFDDFKRQQQQGKVAQQEAFEQYRAEVTARYEEFVREHERAFQEYSKAIAGSWGQKNVLTSTKTRWVGYRRDYSGRERVDFEKGRAGVEVLMDPAEARDPGAVKRRIGEEMTRLLTREGTDDPLETRERVPELQEPLLSGQVETRSGKPVTAATVPEFVDELLSASTPQRKEIVGSDGRSRVAVTVDFALIPNHVRVRAEQYKELILRQSREHQVDAALLFAVVHTESNFNPRARSSAPAYGLMQLVPSSGARAAHVFLFGRDEVVSPDYLYQPSNNVLLGSGYLRLLMTRDFKDVRDDRSRVLCAISAYNTGPANVAKAFTGKRNVPDAVKIINGMTADQVMSKLRSSLPYDETRAYVRNVSERMTMYSEWRQHD
jgi:membrane-bound lytic murein transglycosylase C